MFVLIHSALVTLAVNCEARTQTSYILGSDLIWTRNWLKNKTVILSFSQRCRSLSGHSLKYAEAYQDENRRPYSFVKVRYLIFILCTRNLFVLRIIFLSTCIVLGILKFIFSLKSVDALAPTASILGLVLSGHFQKSDGQNIAWRTNLINTFVPTLILSIVRECLALN